MDVAPLADLAFSAKRDVVVGYHLDRKQVIAAAAG